MKAGVATGPCAVAISPRRAWPLLASRRKEKGAGVGVSPPPGFGVSTSREITAILLRWPSRMRPDEFQGFGF
jgi:hypothetical protein